MTLYLILITPRCIFDQMMDIELAAKEYLGGKAIIAPILIEWCYYDFLEFEHEEELLKFTTIPAIGNKKFPSTNEDAAIDKQVQIAKKELTDLIRDNKSTIEEVKIIYSSSEADKLALHIKVLKELVSSII